MTAAESMHALHAEHCSPGEIAAFLNTTERAVRVTLLLSEQEADDGVARYVDAMLARAK